jgi:phosphohistidine phosphatase SixA
LLGAIVALMLVLPTTPVGAQAGEPVLAPQALVSALQRGGQVLLFRHATADGPPRDPGAFGPCQNPERSLNEAGRAEAQAIGAAIRALRIPVGRVVSSPFCRNIETAHLAFGRAEVTLDLTASFSLDPTTREQLTLMLRRLVSTLPERGTNSVLVSHADAIQDALDLSLEQGEAVILRPDGDGSFSIMAHIQPAEWADLVVAQDSCGLRADC